MSSSSNGKVLYVGEKFNRLLILNQWVGSRGLRSQARVLARCDCGNLKEYWLYSLKSGHTSSCGCLCREVNLEKNTSHGLSKVPAYRTWARMVQRCGNVRFKHYKDYGGRGITVCESWLRFEGFYKDMGDKPSGLELDRIDNSKGYSKENCRWVSHEENGRNTRRSKWWFIDEVRYESLSHAADQLGVGSSTIRGWCQGQTVNGRFYAPRKGCRSALKYQDDQGVLT